MSKKSTDRYEKRIFQYWCATAFEKTQHQSLFNVLHNEDIGRRAIQLHIKKQYVEDVYT